VGRINRTLGTGGGRDEPSFVFDDEEEIRGKKRNTKNNGQFKKAERRA